MNEKRNPVLTANAQELRREMTKEERHLWYDFLKTLPFTVHRQKVIGRYIVDFYIAQARLAIELDGSQHGEEAQLAEDQKRDRFMMDQGIKVLRYTNTDIHQRFEEVCQDIWDHLPEDVLSEYIIRAQRPSSGE